MNGINLPFTFECMYYSQNYGKEFARFCGLLRMYELYLNNLGKDNNC